MKYNSNFLISKKTKEKKSIKTQFYGSVIKHARLATGEYNVNVHLCGSVWYCLISLFGYLFFCCFDWLSPVALSLSSWILTSASSLLLNLSSVFFGSVTVFFSSVTICYFLVFFLYLCWSSHCVHPFFSQVWWASLWLLLWTHQVNRFIKVSILRF